MTRLDFLSLTVFRRHVLLIEKRTIDAKIKNEKKYHDANCFDTSSDQNVNVKAWITSSIY